ncbi:MAG: tetratricopeptide repeat protein [Flavobacterium sp.]
MILLGISFCLLNFYKIKTDPKPKNTDNSAEILRLTNIADKLYYAKKNDSAFIYYNKVLPLCNPEKNTEDYVYTIYSISYIYNDNGNFIASEATAILALPYLKYLKKTRHAWIVYTLLGSNYSNMYDYNNAILYYEKSRALKTSAWRKCLALNNIAAVYMNQKKYGKAIALLEILVSPRLKSINEEGYGYAADNLGFCYHKLGNDEKAIKYLRKGLAFRLLPNKRTGIENSYKNLSVYFEKKDKRLAKYYAKKTYDESVANNNSADQNSGLKLLIKTSEGNDLKKYSLKYIKSTDSLTNARQKAKNQFANIKYNFNKDKTENLQLKAEKAENELELERRKNRNIISYIIIVFIISFITFLYFHLKSKGRKQKDAAIFDSEIRISKKLSDELTHDIYQTLTFAESNDLEKDNNKENLLSNLDLIYSKTRNISKENSPVVIDKNYPLALKEMISGFQTSEINVILNGFDSILSTKIDKNKKITIYRVLHELLLNMKKHSNASLVVINFNTSNNYIFINYMDNGKGIHIDDLSFKNGLKNVENRILNIKGEINIDSRSDMGFKVFIKLIL